MRLDKATASGGRTPASARGPTGNNGGYPVATRTAPMTEATRMKTGRAPVDGATGVPNCAAARRGAGSRMAEAPGGRGAGR
jgi:hypothetical protein